MDQTESRHLRRSNERLGSDRIVVYRITDFMTPIVILENPIISRDIHEDGASREFPNVVDEFWIGVAETGFTFGCFRVHPMSRTVWQIHARILPNYRSRYAEISAKLALKWCFDNIPDIQIIICLVPQAHKNVDLFVRRVGFSKVGTLEKSYLKNGKLVDIKIYQIRGEKCQQQL